MYNRYIPQPDGSFRRSRVQEQNRPQSRPPQPPKQESGPRPQEEHREAPKSEPKKEPCAQPNKPEQNHRREERHPSSRQEQSVTSFLRQLLPKDFDTGDLFIVLLLLLMAGDCAEDQNTALLTLALYFFM